MKTAQQVRLVINKTVVPTKKGRGRRVYGWLLVTRLLAYAVLTGVFSNKGLRKHLEKNERIAKTLGFKAIPHRTTISRWKRKYRFLEKVVASLGNLVTGVTSNILLIFDSTPIVDEKDPEAKAGYYSKGPFKGFKLHLASNQGRIPIRARFTDANVHDSQPAPDLIDKTESLFGLADAAYDSKRIRELLRSNNSMPKIGSNPRNSGKRKYTPKLLKRFRYLVEQAIEMLKNKILKRQWTRVKGFCTEGKSCLYSSDCNASSSNNELSGRQRLFRQIQLQFMNSSDNWDD